MFVCVFDKLEGIVVVNFNKCFVIFRWFYGLVINIFNLSCYLDSLFILRMLRFLRNIVNGRDMFFRVILY